MEREKLLLGLGVYACSPSILGRLRQDNCCEFEASMDHMVSHKSLDYRERFCLKKQERKGRRDRGKEGGREE